MTEKLYDYDLIAQSVIDGDGAQVANLVKKAVEGKCPAGEILNRALIQGMNEVGALFREGEMFVPEVLMSAKALQTGIDIIRPALVEAGVRSIGKVLTVTVEGDLHDIGIKLVGMMLEGAGFEVINIGVDKNAQDIVDSIKEYTPDILAMSAMLTTTMVNMGKVVALLKQEKIFDNISIMIGGAPVSAKYAADLGCHYSSDAHEAVRVAKQLVGLV